MGRYLGRRIRAWRGWCGTQSSKHFFRSLQAVAPEHKTPNKTARERYRSACIAPGVRLTSQPPWACIPPIPPIFQSLQSLQSVPRFRICRHSTPSRIRRSWVRLAGPSTGPPRTAAQADEQGLVARWRCGPCTSWTHITRSNRGFNTNSLMAAGCAKCLSGFQCSARQAGL